MSGPDIEYSWRDGRLRAWPLRALNAVGGAAARAGLPLPSLAPDAIVEAARKRAGGDELGDDSYREPLERYVDAAESEAELTTLGRLGVRQMLVSSLANRIQLAGYEREHPETLTQEIEAPWVIAGLPRTGTSLLSILLGLDPTARPLLHWEAAAPIPPPSLATAAEDPRIAANAKQLEGLHRLNPALRAMHPFGATIAQECVALFMLDLRTLGMETQAYVPSYGRWLQGCDMSPAYAQHQRALRVLQSGQPTERWVLKTPNHLWCFETLLATYPDARVIWTHRDPGVVVTSLASLVNTLQGVFTKRRDPKPVANDWNAKSLHAIERGMAYDGRAPEGWCQHVAYRALIADPLETVRRIYAHYDQEPSPLHEKRMQAWIDSRGQTSFGRHVYDPVDFGWSYDGLAEQYASYRERYDVDREAV